MIIVLGANGQLGYDLTKALEKGQKNFKTITRNDVDVSDINSLKNFLLNEEFTFLINCTSYHKTDEVENNVEQAFTINAKAPKAMAEICHKKKSVLFHISTDYVFGGNDEDKPLDESSSTSPLNIYGLSKLQGENFIRKTLNENYIFRVASLFGEAGASGKGGNFVEAIYNKALNEKKISVVDDQIMSPTSTDFISKTVLKFINNNYEFGIYNVVNQGAVSWYDFACKICEICGIEAEKKRIKSSDLNLNALRPSYSALSTSKLENLGIVIPNYEDELATYLKRKGYISS